MGLDQLEKWANREGIGASGDVLCLIDELRERRKHDAAEPAGRPEDVVCVPRDTLNRALALITFAVHEHGGNSYGQEQPGWEGATLLMEELEAVAPASARSEANDD